MNYLSEQVVFLGFGGNQGDVAQQIHFAAQQLGEYGEISLSSMYTSKPLGNIVQNDFINAVGKTVTCLPLHKLLQYTKALEQKFNKIKVHQWGPRYLDIDLLMTAEHTVMQKPDLVLPHPHMLTRDFVLRPLAEIAPGLIMHNDKTVEECLNACAQKLVIKKLTNS